MGKLHTTRDRPALKVGEKDLNKILNDFVDFSMTKNQSAKKMIEELKKISIDILKI